MNEKRYRVFVLGAGFSRVAGLPLAGELWAEIRRRARGLPGMACKFQQDLDAYLEFRRRCDGKKLTDDDVDFEDFMRFLDVEHFLGLRGPDTWSEDGNEGTMVTKWLLGQILVERTPSPEDIPDLYLEFARQLQPSDRVLTFNYDVLLERALDVVGKPYRLFPFRYESVREDGSAIVNGSRDEVVVLKLHGSLDWFDRRRFTALEETYRRQGATSGPMHRVFSHMGELAVAKLDNGPRHPDDLMAEMYRVGNIEYLYAQGLSFRCAPWLLAPSALKILYADKLRDFWYGLNRGGVMNYGMAIIGYSMPLQDDYARQAVYTLARNYQEEYWDENVHGMRKTPLVVVDFCPDKARRREFLARYRFVDWERARLFQGGFDEEVLKVVFDAG